jgi:hypothetical protein
MSSINAGYFQASTPSSLLLMPTFDFTADFANWWGNNFPNSQCPALPKKPADLPLSALMLLEQDNPALHQNLFGNGGMGSAPMPADTVARRNSGQLQESDIPFLRASGLHYEAAQVAQQAQRQQDQRLVDVARAEAAASKEQRQFSEAWNNASFGERLAMSGGPSPEAIAQAREAWGITQ